MIVLLWCFHTDGGLFEAGTLQKKETIVKTWGSMKTFKAKSAATKGYSHFQTLRQRQNAVFNAHIFLPICRWTWEEYTYQRLGFKPWAEKVCLALHFVGKDGHWNQEMQLWKSASDVSFLLFSSSILNATTPFVFILHHEPFPPGSCTLALLIKII